MLDHKRSSKDKKNLRPVLRPVFIFVLIVFVISWLIALAIYLGGGLQSMAALGIYLYMLIPALGSFIMRKFITKEGFKNSGLKLSKFKYYAYGWLIFVIIVSLAYVLTVLFGLASWDWGMRILPAEIKQSLPEEISPPMFFALIFLANTIIGPVIGIPFTFSEEYGWRSYLLPKLLPLGRLRALITHGIIWGIWHAPIILMGHNYPGYPIWGVFLMIILTILSGIILGWLYFASGSIFVPAFAHGVMNNAASSFIIIVTLFNPTLGGITGAVGLGILLTAVLILHFSGALGKIKTRI
jgi:membrane protease YdiL (CAAX protease family)